MAFAITGQVTIGRETDNTIVITDDSYISARHARVLPAEGTVVVEDLASRNGTFLNGKRLVKSSNYILNQGDEIAVGVGKPQDVIRFVVLFNDSIPNNPGKWDALKSLSMT